MDFGAKISGALNCVVRQENDTFLCSGICTISVLCINKRPDFGFHVLCILQTKRKLMSRLQRNYWLLASIVFGVLLAVVSFGPLFLEPWHAIPETAGDAAKNSFTYLYHSIYGSGYHFTGMNYPYGEHIVYTDGVPLLSVFFASIGNVSVGTALSAFWWLLGLSYVLSVVYVFKTLLRLDVLPAFALVFAGLICIMTPQLLRIAGHFGLFLTSVIPMLQYWTLAYFQERKIKFVGYVLLLGCVVVFIHPYYAGLILVWVAFYSLAYLLFVRDRLINIIKHVVPLILVSAAVPAVMLVTMKLTDSVVDRPITPYSSAAYFTTINRVVSSYFSPFWKFLTDISVIDNAATGGEGYTYVGLVVLIVSFSTVILYILRKRRGEQPFDYFTGSGNRIWLFMAFGALVLGAGIPFRWGLMWLKDYVFIFKQFRTLGRFTWIFYYVICTWVVVVIMIWYRALISANKTRQAVLLLATAIGIWSVEASGYVRLSRAVGQSSVSKYNATFCVNEQGWVDFLHRKGLNASDFQAILLLKFIHIGTDKIWVGDAGQLITLGTRASLQLHLPIVDAMMARSSWHVALQQVKIVAGPFADKKILKDIESRKPFLLLDYDTDSLSPDERYLLASSDFIGNFQECRIYACYPERIKYNDSVARRAVDDILVDMAGIDTCIGDTTFWYVNHYENMDLPTTLWGSGAMDAIKKSDSCVATVSVPKSAEGCKYEFSCWFLLSREDPRSASIDLDYFDKSGKKILSVAVKGYDSKDSYEMWFRANQYFYMPKGCRTIKCTVLNEPQPSYIAMDEMQLRPASALIISKGSDGVVMANNHLLTKAVYAGNGK